MGEQMIEEIGATDITSYVYGNYIDEILIMHKNNQNYYYHGNHLGSIMALTDSEGELLERMEYDAFGQPFIFDVNNKALANSQIRNRILFAGREINEETGTYHLRTRDMSPQIGRFLQKDPLMYIDGLNDLTYVVNNPVMRVDPYGTSFEINPDWFRVNKSDTRNNYNEQKHRLKKQGQQIASIFCNLEEGMRNHMNELNQNTHDFNQNNIDFWKDQLDNNNDPMSDLFKRWLDDLSDLNETNPYMATFDYALMGASLAWGAGGLGLAAAGEGTGAVVTNSAVRGTAGRAASSNVVTGNFGRNAASNVVKGNFGRNAASNAVGGNSARNAASNVVRGNFGNKVTEGAFGNSVKQSAKKVANL